MPAEDRYAYAEGLRRGGVVVSVRTEETDYERVLEILDREGAVDLDKQQAGEKKAGPVIRVKARQRVRPQPAELPREI